MKHVKTKHELDEQFLLLYGGNNEQNPPFNVGDKLKQIWRVDDNGDLIKDGREMVEFVGMKGDMMLLKTLNIYAAHSEDNINPYIVKMSKKAGYKPVIGDVFQLHYMYADRYEVVSDVSVSGITKGFKFRMNGEDLTVVEDYEKDGQDRYVKVDRTEYNKKTGKSAYVVLDKDVILNYLKSR